MINERLEILEIEFQKYKNENNAYVEQLEKRYISTISELQSIVAELERKISKLEKKEQK